MVHCDSLQKIFFCFFLLGFVSSIQSAPISDEINLKENSTIFIGINPKSQNVEVNWMNLDLNSSVDVTIMITDGPITIASMEEYLGASRWVVDEGREILFDLTLNTSSGRQQTHLKYSFAKNRRLDIDTGCYSFWYSLVVDEAVVSSGCLQTNGYWMNDMRDQIKDRKFRELFIPGTHDSASYKYNFDPEKMETLVTRYTLTQDDDIYSQLVHGIRYLDIRVGYYRSNEKKFWANHGISRLFPLSDILRQVKEFVDSTNEIVILDFQEFPVGFGKNIDVHKQLAFYLFNELSEYAADPELTWDARLGEIWAQGKRVIVAYDHYGIAQNENLGILWQSVRQRWGKVKDSSAQLQKFLKESRANLTREFQTSRPFAEMAELTPEAVDVLTNRLGGLRSMADRVNFDVSQLYSSDFGAGANVVAVDFFRATNIVDAAIKWNKKKSYNRHHHD